MAYAVLRVKKLKSRVALVQTVQHDARMRHPDNADIEKTAKNIYMYEKNSLEAAMQNYTEKLPEKVRKNAVHAVEVVITASKEFFDLNGKTGLYYLQDAAIYMINKLGGEDNILFWAIHMDEKTPHIHLVMMPLYEGKLNYKHYLGGKKDALIQLQSDFAREVGEKYGLERGRPRIETGRKHITVGQYYAIGQDAVNREIARQRQSWQEYQQRKEAESGQRENRSRKTELRNSRKNGPELEI